MIILKCLFFSFMEIEYHIKVISFFQNLNNKKYKFMYIYYSIFSNLWVMTIKVFSLVNSNSFSCIILSVYGSILEVASSKQTISFSSFNITLSMLIIYFSPLDKFSPDFSI